MSGNSRWFTLEKRKEQLIILYSSRLYRLLRDSTYKKDEPLNIVSFIGATLKDKFLKYTAKNFSKIPCRAVNLYRTYELSKTDTLFADIRCYEQVSVTERREDPSTRLLSTSIEDIRTNVRYLYVKLLYLFSPLTLVFVDDFASIEELVDLLKDFIYLQTLVVKPKPLSPTLVLVTYRKELKVESTLEYILHQELIRVGLVDIVTNLDIRYITINWKTNQRRYRNLLEILHDYILENLDKKIEAKINFSGLHYNVFFKYACDNFILSPKSALNLLQIARHSNPLPFNYNQRISKFIVNSTNMNVNYNFERRLLSSALLMNSYPPEMHRKISSSIWYIQPPLI